MATETSINSWLASNNLYGAWPVMYLGRVATGTTAATTTSGYQSAQKCRAVITVPNTLTAGLSGILFPCGSGMAEDAGVKVVAAIETSLGTLTVANPMVFAAGSTMPSYLGLQTASEMCVAVVTTACAGWTTPALTITYQNQDGTGSQTASMTLPSNPVIDTVFIVDPHLANADNGVQKITNITSSVTGTSGVLTFFGLRILSETVGASANHAEGPYYNFHKPRVLWPTVGNDQIGVYRIGVATGGDVLLFLEGLGT